MCVYICVCRNLDRVGRSAGICLHDEMSQGSRWMGKVSRFQIAQCLEITVGRDLQDAKTVWARVSKNENNKKEREKVEVSLRGKGNGLHDRCYVPMTRTTKATMLFQKWERRREVRQVIKTQNASRLMLVILIRIKRNEERRKKMERCLTQRRLPSSSKNEIVSSFLSHLILEVLERWDQWELFLLFLSRQ